MTDSDLRRIWRWVYYGALQGGSLEPKDAAQEVIRRCLENGRDPVTVAATKPSAFRWVAGRREAIAQWRKHFQVQRGKGAEVSFVSHEDWMSPQLDVEEAAITNLMLAEVPAEIVDLAVRSGRGGGVTGRERLKLYRWRQKRRAS
jgi:hypothetical protein